MIMTLSSTEAAASSALKIVHRNCPFCDRDNSAEPANRYSSPPWTIRTCSGCGFVYIDTAPEYVHLAVELDWDTTYAAEIQRKAKTRKISPEEVDADRHAVMTSRRLSAMSAE
jgi:hypothetical protein